MASTVESSHLPEAGSVSIPRLVKASWISLMRSGVGAAWPFAFLDLLDFLPEVLEDFAEVDFVLALAFADVG